MWFIESMLWEEGSRGESRLQGREAKHRCGPCWKQASTWSLRELWNRLVSPCGVDLLLSHGIGCYLRGTYLPRYLGKVQVSLEVAPSISTFSSCEGHPIHPELLQDSGK